MKIYKLVEDQNRAAQANGITEINWQIQNPFAVQCFLRNIVVRMIV